MTAICKLSQRKHKTNCKKNQTGGSKKNGYSKKEELKATSEEIRQNRLELQEFKEIGKILYRSIREAAGEDPE